MWFFETKHQGNEDKEGNINDYSAIFPVLTLLVFISA